MIRYSYTETELKKLLDTLTIVVDTRENVNDHILRYLHEKKIPHVNKKLDTGDYSAMIPKNPELGIMRDIYLEAFVERKNSVNEITGNLQKDTRKAFENELIRSQGKSFLFICEELDGYKKIVTGDYRSRYNPKALLGTLLSFQIRYGFRIEYIDKKFSGNYIYHHLYHYAREYLKKGMI